MTKSRRMKTMASQNKQELFCPVCGNRLNYIDVNNQEEPIEKDTVKSTAPKGVSDQIKKMTRIK